MPPEEVLGTWPFRAQIKRRKFQSSAGKSHNFKREESSLGVR